MNDLYEIIFARRSIRKYNGEAPLSDHEIQTIAKLADQSQNLVEGISTRFVITPSKLSNVKFGQHSVLLYSQNHPYALLNAGYKMQQLDLELAKRSIGSCWYGWIRPTARAPQDMTFIIQLAIGGESHEEYRKGMEEFSRKPMDEIWEGDFDKDVQNAVRLSPSACNSQCWRIKNEGKTIQVFRDSANKSPIPKARRPYFNTIDMGICLCHLELALNKKSMRFTRVLAQPTAIEEGLIPIATYTIG